MPHVKVINAVDYLSTWVVISELVF